MATIKQNVILRGTVTEANKSRMTFKLQPVYGPNVSAPIPEQHLQTIIEAFSGFRESARVVVQGTGLYDLRGCISSLQSISHISLLNPLDVPARLDEFRSMKDGWLEGQGVAPAHTGLDWLSASFERNFPGDLPLPYVFPTPEGGIEAEWRLGPCSVIFGIDLDTHRGDWLEVDKRHPDDERSKELDLNEDSDWEWITSEIRRLTNAAI